MEHVEVVVPDFFVFLIIVPMGKLVRLHGENRSSNEFPMINSAAMGTVAMASVERLVVDKSCKALIDGVSDTDFLGVLVDDGGARVVGEEAFEAGGAVAVVF